MSRSTRQLLLRSAALLLLATSGASGADREYVLKWMPPPDTAVDGYRVHVTPEARTEGQTIDVGSISPDADGMGRYPLLLDAEIGHFLHMTAYNSAGESAPSNEIFVAAALCDVSACEDGNLCTADACGTAGCSHAPLPDGTACGLAGEMCLGGGCSVAECVVDADCGDGNVCDGTLACESFRCVSAAPALSCNSSSPCATAVCDAVSGCLSVPLADGMACDDGDPATRRDQCRTGVCVGTAKIADGTKGRGRDK